VFLTQVSVQRGRNEEFEARLCPTDEVTFPFMLVYFLVGVSTRRPPCFFALTSSVLHASWLVWALGTTEARKQHLVVIHS
jgi:hypothetical protein